LPKANPQFASGYFLFFVVEKPISEIEILLAFAWPPFIPQQVY
jgi:hypothetical protein